MWHHSPTWLLANNYYSVKTIFRTGDTKQYRFHVTEADCAAFQGELVHPVYATFALARDFEWSSRLFFLEMKDADEEGVGTMLTIEHKGMARVGDEVLIIATVESLIGTELICTVEATCQGRVLAIGRTGQKMLKKEKLYKLMNR
jgi:fluoroacetyl-CoA thioesterase